MAHLLGTNIPQKYLELSLKDVSTQFWKELDSLLYDKFEQVVISLSENAGNKCYSYRTNEIVGLYSQDRVQLLLLDWADKKRATVADLGYFLHSSKNFGAQSFELLRHYCGE